MFGMFAIFCIFVGSRVPLPLSSVIQTKLSFSVILNVVKNLRSVR